MFFFLTLIKPCSSSGDYLGLPAGLDTAVELVTGTDPVAANNEAATVGCNMAVGLVGSSLADHTEVASVRDKQSIEESVGWAESIIMS